MTWVPPAFCVSTVLSPTFTVSTALLPLPSITAITSRPSKENSLHGTPFCPLTSFGAADVLINNIDNAEKITATAVITEITFLVLLIKLNFLMNKYLFFRK